MRNNYIKWLLLFGLSFIWGSSYILNKFALVGLTYIQIGVLRLLISAAFLLLIGFSSLKKIPKHKWKYIIYIAMLGSFFQAFLYPLAMTGIDSSVASILNSLTPLNTLIIGFSLFGFAFKKHQLLGVFVGLAGAVLLIVNGAELQTGQNYWFAIYIIISSVGIAFNVNILKKYLTDVPALSITTGVFTVLIIPSVLTLLFSGFLKDFHWHAQTQTAIGYITILAIFGTGIATIMYNRMAQIATPVFSASVSYIIPIVAIFWGLMDGERLSIPQFFACGLILVGVYLVNRK